MDPSGPSGGALLINLVQTTSLVERINQGGIIGYIILAIGGITLLYAIYKYVMLWMGREVPAQLASATPKSNNPLGRVLKVGASHMKETIDRLELKLAEAIMAERPSIERGISFVKIVFSSSAIGRTAWNSDRYDCYFPTNNIIWNRRS